MNWFGIAFIGAIVLGVIIAYYAEKNNIDLKVV